MALFEFQVVQRNGSIERRYSDRPVVVGQEIRIGAHRVVVVRRVDQPSSPFADAAFLCQRLVGAPSRRPVSKAPAIRRRAA